LHFVWDYGVLKPSDEKIYIDIMVKKFLKDSHEDVKTDLFVELLFESQEFIRYRDGIPKKEMPISLQAIKSWVEECEDEIEKCSKQIICDLKRIWDNKYYQERSVLINEATFTHDILPSLLNFISPGYFKRWDQAQSISAKDRGARKFGDTIGTITRDGSQFEILFVEVSYGPFHPDPELHISEDNIKLGKLGKDSIDRIGKLLNTDEIPIILIHFFQDEISFYLMDKEFSPA